MLHQGVRCPLAEKQGPGPGIACTGCCQCAVNSEPVAMTISRFSRLSRALIRADGIVEHPIGDAVSMPGRPLVWDVVACVMVWVFI